MPYYLSIAVERMKDMKTKINWTGVLNFACAVLMLALIVFQFVLPFWVDSDGEPATIQGYLWLCEEDEYKQLSKDMKKEYGKDYRADIWPMPFLCLLLGLIGIGLIVFQPKNFLVSALPVACGIIGTIGYLTKPIYQTGNLQIVHVIPCVLMTVAGLAAFMVGVMAAVKKAKAARIKKY